MYRNVATTFVKRTQIVNQFRQISISEELNRRGFTGSRTHFYSSLGNKNYMAKRTSRNRFEVPTVENVPQLRAGVRNFSTKMVDPYGDRPHTALPMTKLPKPEFNWNENITAENQLLLKELDKDQKDDPIGLFKDINWPIYKYKLGSRRCGLIMRKIGVEALYLRDGKKQICTLFQVDNCHVIKYFPRHEYNGKTGCIIVGAGLGNPYLKNEAYLDYCLEAGVSPKSKLARFPVTENARIESGRQLHLQHFHVGQKVDIVQRSVDYGHQDMVTRFHKKEVRADFSKQVKAWKIRGRRVGSIGGRGNTMGRNPNTFDALSGRPLKGRRMPGQLGGVDTPAWSRKILRMNTKFQVMWVKGRTPGHVGDFARVYDTRTTANMVNFAKEPPMFPTYIPELHGTEWTDEIFDPSVHPFDEPSITFS